MSKYVRTKTIYDPQHRGRLTYIREDNRLYLSMLHVKWEHRMQGVGGALLDDFCKYADKVGQPAYLTVQPFEYGPATLPFLPLRDFYRRRGFVSISYERMMREPRKA